MELIISIIAGMIGGTGAGGVIKKLSTGKLGNMISGGLGGLLGNLGGLLGSTGGDPNIGAAAGGAAGGGILMLIFGLVKKSLLKK